jgi:ketosteroid isomerase-like protein
MRTIFLIAVVALLGINAAGQEELQKLVDTERAFAALAAEKGMKPAFLEHTAPDGVLFLPDKVKAVDYWNARGESKGLLSWSPNYADVSSNGMIGYTTGNWEFRPNGKDDTPSGFGDFITIWQRMQEGGYKFIVDIGVEHEKPANYSTDLAPPSYPADPNEKNSSAADSANSFFETAARMGLNKAYDAFAADEVRAYREGNLPILGKKKLIGYTKSRKTKMTMSRRSTSFGSADIAYISSTYTETKEDGSVEKGNFVQIWKLIDGRWRIVLDIFKPIPAKQG